ncbi:hypothetical protein FAZ19_18935 [Sphingobacterium alkalisoli]|uniref:DUF5623 domain-containing protein n=1 Tax=Sphingobacterium alkalisoli TaxID=1874115 RepID=A0A4U0GU21_9SPHI|nr:DUF5623 domain-containing protein [Sphingobacterium alkalisoli]TJY62550.1 hypothetical protein FAZ19_18935 [Sphingobacterium alkalisoli]
MALDMIALEYGYKNWMHYIKEIKQVQIRLKQNLPKRPASPTPDEIAIHDVIYGRVLGQRPNRNMSTRRHKKIGKILAELLEETTYHKRAHKILFQIRVDLDSWLGEEYGPSVMGNAEFNSIYYGSHTEFVDDIPSARRQAQLRTLLRQAKKILLSAYHDCKSLEKLLGQFDNALDKLESWPKSIRVKGAPKRQLRSGTFVQLKQTKELLLVFNHDMRSDVVVGFNDAGTFEAGRHEVSVLRSQPNLSKYRPLRLYLPYGKCTLDDGTEVLFNRDYCPLWSRSLSGTVKEVDLLSDLDFNGAEHFFFERDAPYTKNGNVNHEKCLEILREWGVADRQHKILDHFQEAVRRGRVGDIMPKPFS